MKITDATKGRWKELLPSFGYHPSSNPRLHGPCPICGGKDRFRFDDRDGTGSWFCNQCGHGDGLDLVQKLSGMGFNDVRSELFRMLGITPGPVAPGPSEEESKFKMALKSVWSGATLARNDSPLGVYLMRRTGISEPPSQLRYHPALFNPTMQCKLPAMVAKVVSHESVAINLHCTFLTHGGEKADINPSKRVMRGPLPDGCAIRIGPAAPVMGIAEGIETAISASVLYRMPVWAAVNGNLLAKWIPPDIAKEIHIFGDNDLNFTGQSKAYALANRLAVQHKLSVHVMIPPMQGYDWNDHHRIILDSLT
jgi:putative DNA primase/helicase